MTIDSSLEFQFRESLKELVNSGLGFKPLSDWMVENSELCAKLVAVWTEELINSKPYQAECFLRLLNLVVRNNGGKVYIQHFQAVIEEVFTKVLQGIIKEDELFNKLQEMVQLWHSKEMFGPVVGDKLQKILNNHKKLIKLHEMFPSRDASDLNTALTLSKGNLEAASDHIMTLERNEKKLSLITSTQGVCWADYDDEETPENSELIAAQRSAAAPRPQQASDTKKKPAPVKKKEKASEISRNVDLSKLGDNEQKYVMSLEAKIRQLESTVSKQTNEIARLSKSHQKLDDFVREMRGECAKLIQRQMNLERGLTSPDDTPRSGSQKRGSKKTLVSPKLNAQAAPFVPNFVFSPSCSMSLEAADASSTCNSEVLTLTESDVLDSM